ncbi:metallophosphoesterase [Paraclostridium ghonii]|uniref:metallophosphoesterase n=1 Tax=Paraclostridium ghonii TaxID=29358 RepID=UPI00202CFD94|nr:metallophosphoesterase [Paeniclostridium ghonii]MCM0166465.1 metallophosphoesterase [Paeniclostridium ghonii]
MFTQVLIGSTIVLGTALFLNREINSIETTRYEMKNRKIPKEFDNFKIVQVSDLHNKTFGKNNEKLLNQIDSEEPDIVVITGDLVEGDKENFHIALNFLDELVKKYKVYHIIGNHEQKSLIKKYKKEYETYFKELSKKPIINLENDKVILNKGKSSINIYGFIIPLENYPYFFKNFKNRKKGLDENFIQKSLGKINREEYNMMLAHTPFFFEDYTKYGADLVLSGHVHGGIIRLPIVGGVLSPNREFFPKYDFGIYKKDNTTMIINKGLGSSKVLVRFNCRPEIVSITLKSEDY